MGIWVRSQDKKRLVFTKALDCDKSHSYDGDTSYQICSIQEKCLAFLLGTYPTEARALEVLDAMQTRIDRIEMGKAQHAAILWSVFEMPEE